MRHFAVWSLATALVCLSSLVDAATITAITPNRGSVLGQTRVTVSGTGFDIRGRSNDVFIGTGLDGTFCDPVPNDCAENRIVCLTDPHEGAGKMPLSVRSFNFLATCFVASGCTFEYTQEQTPEVTGITPEWGTAGDEITVEAPRTVPIPVERNPYTGAAIATTTVRMSVLYGDLDLTTQRDSDRLMLRIRNVARDACKQLDRLYPLNPDENCVDRTVENAAPLGQAVIAAARGH